MNHRTECDRVRPMLQAYVDSELDETQSKVVFEHLAECHGCAVEALTALHLKRMVKASGYKYAPGAAFKSRIGKLSQDKRRFTPARWSVLAACAAALVIALSLFALRPSSSSVPNAELADLHVSMLASSNPVDVVSTDRHTVKPWFQGRVPFAFDVPEVAGTPYSLIGGRQVAMRGAPAAQLVYGYQKHRISVFVWQSPNVQNASLRESTVAGFSVVSWQKGDVAFAAVGDASEQTVRGLAELFR